MSFFKKLFGGGEGGKEETQTAVVYEGFSITPKPMKEGDQYRVAGRITKVIGGEEKEHMLIRADVYPSKDTAVEATVMKAKRVIDEQGETIFG